MGSREKPLRELEFGSKNCDDLRARGWAVAVHNDYRQHDNPHTFWLLTRKFGPHIIALVGEGLDDTIALDKVRFKAEQYDTGVWKGQFGE